MNPDIDYLYLDVDNEKLYTTRGEYLAALADRGSQATERCITNYAHGQVLFAAGAKAVNDFGDSFSEVHAIQMCRRLTGLDRHGQPRSQAT